jgi:hypothetical protein
MNTHPSTDGGGHADRCAECPFSEKARGLLRTKGKDYVRALISLSTSLARQEPADAVSAAHVEKASQLLIQRPRHRLYGFLSAFGGILVGVCLSTVFGILVSNQHSGWATLLCVCSGIVGTVLMALNVTTR